MEKNPYEFRYLVGSSSIILLNDKFKYNIFIITTTEYLNIKSNKSIDLTGMNFYSLSGESLDGYEFVKGDIREILILIVSLINGKYNLFKYEEDEFIDRIIEYYKLIDFDTNSSYIMTLIKLITIKYKLNNNYFEDKELPFFENAIDKMIKPVPKTATPPTANKYLNFKKKYLKYKSKYLSLKNKYKL
jgi:hypothetical protein